VISRRRFIQALATLPAASGLGPRAQVSASPSRLALVVGNDAYPDAPLLNSRNDARAMGKLLGEAGFSVETLLDGGRVRMQETFARFGAAIHRPEVRQVFLFYAGHGVQLDWHNYLVPVDARVAASREVPARCVELAGILRRFGEARGKVFVIMLDACRNDPFGGGYRPDQKGLSQFDAPAGSLLAYSTAPGSAASDGAGSNSLYTENLLRELAVRGARLEDALKRVRLNVRLASRGLQVPWESTSLETDFYVFEDGGRKLNEEELEAEIEADVALWNSVKPSKRPEDWIGYLRRFPNGRFAEMVQLRLARLGVEAGLPAFAPTSPDAAPPAGATPPRIATEAEYHALPMGTLYVDPDGVTRRKS
jgi:hypothetical protein